MKEESLTLGGKGILNIQQPWLKQRAACLQDLLLATRHQGCDSGLLVVAKISGLPRYLPAAESQNLTPR